MRTFIAIEISPEMQGACAQVISHLKYSGADVKWVSPGNIHMTIKFLGEIDEGRCEAVKKALDDVAGAVRQFGLGIKDIGAFPKIDFPRVIWVGFDEGKDEAGRIAVMIDSELSRLGFAKESRPFSPHLTIGRVRSSKNKDKLKEKISTYSLPLNSYRCNVTSIVLFQSTLTPQGSIYTKLHEARLQQ